MTKRNTFMTAWKLLRHLQLVQTSLMIQKQNYPIAMRLMGYSCGLKQPKMSSWRLCEHNEWLKTYNLRLDRCKYTYNTYINTHLGWGEWVVNFLLCSVISTDRKNMSKIRMAQLEKRFANWQTEGKKWQRQRSEAGWVCEQREKKWLKQLMKCL